MEGLNAGTSQTSPTLGAIEPLSWAETLGGHRDSPETLPHCWSCRVLDVLVGMMVGIVVGIAVVTMVGIMEDFMVGIAEVIVVGIAVGITAGHMSSCKTQPCKGHQRQL